MALVRLRCFVLFLAFCFGLLACWVPPVSALLTPPPPLLALPLLDVRVLTGGASSGLCLGLGLSAALSPAAAAAVLSDVLACLSSERFGAPAPDLSDFFELLPPNSRLKKPGLLSPLLDIV